MGEARARSSTARLPLVRIALVLWALFIVYGTTIPFDFVLDRQAIGESWEEAAKVPWVERDGRRPSLTDAATNLLLFLPWGFLLAVLLERRGISAIASVGICVVTAAAFSLSVELLQLLSPTRTTSATDLVHNAIGSGFGGAAGWLVGGPLVAFVAPVLRTEARRRPLAVLAVAVSAGVLLWTLVPFDFTLDLGELKHSVKTARLDPLARGEQSGGSGVGLIGRLPILLAWVPIGGVLALAFGSWSDGRRALRSGLLSVAVLAIASELGQVFVNSRVVDAADALAALVGGAIGCLVARAGRSLGPRRLLDIALGCIVAALLFAGTRPWSFTLPSAEDLDRIRLVPFLHYFVKTDAGALADAVGQLVAYLPVGILLVLRQPGLRATEAGVIAGLLALAVEVGQLFLAERTTDPTDVLLAGFAAAAGVLLWRRALTLVESPTARAAYSSRREGT